MKHSILRLSLAALISLGAAASLSSCGDGNGDYVIKVQFVPSRDSGALATLAKNLLINTPITNSIFLQVLLTLQQQKLCSLAKSMLAS